VSDFANRIIAAFGNSMAAPRGGDLREQIARLTEERDLAIAHDRQPYPTAWAHAQALSALETHRKRADDAEAERDGLLAELTALTDGVTALMDTVLAKLPVESRVRVRLAELAVLDGGAS
jgi:hypothetical protein